MDIKQTQLEKIRKTAKPIAIIAKVLEVFAWIAAIGMAVGTVFLVAMGTSVDFAEFIEETVNFPGVMIDATGAPTVANVIAIGAVMVAFFILAIILMRCVNKTFKLLSSGASPFSDEVLKKFKTMAIVLFIIVLLNDVITGVIVGLALWTLYSIFQYGASLQTEVDETL